MRRLPRILPDQGEYEKLGRGIQSSATDFSRALRHLVALESTRGECRPRHRPIQAGHPRDTALLPLQSL